MHHLGFLKPMNAPSQKYLYKAFQEYKVIQTCCCCSVVQLCPTFCNPMGCSTPGLHVPHHLQKFAQVHIHCISDVIQPSSSDALFSCPQSFPASGTFVPLNLTCFIHHFFPLAFTTSFSVSMMFHFVIFVCFVLFYFFKIYFFTEG